jgi:cell division cycle 14
MSTSPPRPSSSTAVDIIPGQFIFCIAPPDPSFFSFTIEENPVFQFRPFFAEFGPLSLHQIHRFVLLSRDHLRTHAPLVQFYCNSNPIHISNSLLLAAAFRLIHLGLRPEEALAPLCPLLPRARPYRDACPFPPTYELTVAACIHGLARAVRLGWYDFASFDADRWEELEQLARGDMNWLVPGKLLALAAPYHTSVVQGIRVCTPVDLVPVFRSLGITTIVRLNEHTYDETVFTGAGFRFVEMFFPDGTCPPQPIVVRFLELVEGEEVLALHCKAGLGRTFVWFLMTVEHWRDAILSRNSSSRRRRRSDGFGCVDQEV